MPSHIPQFGNLFEFDEEDVFHNTIKAHPRVNFYIYNNRVYYNNENRDSTNHHTPNGHINLHDLNVNRNFVSSSTDDQLIYPFVTKQGSFTSFSTVSTGEFNLDHAYGDVIQGTYPLTASISVDRYAASFTGAKKNVLYALRNALNYYTPLSPHYAYSSSFGDKTGQKLNVISIPSIFYGSSIEKGSVRLKYYVTGTLIGEASDTKKNGVLYQTTGSTTGGSVGVVLYNEGFIMLTASSAIRDDHTEAYDTSATAYAASWHYFATNNSNAGAPSSSFSIDFNGTTNIQTMTLFAHAKENQLNFSNNPTFLSESAAAYKTGRIYHQDSERKIKNIVSSSYANHSASFKPVTYISKVGIYDENKNLIAVASLANPVRKLEDRNYTFKLKLDI
jgi:hypothetical protein